MAKTITAFVPVLKTEKGRTDHDYDFYRNAFDATEINRVVNDDGSIHVMEMLIDGALLQFHEEMEGQVSVSPKTANGTTVQIGLFLDDVHGIMKKALAAGAVEKTPVTDYDYGYRQGEFVDPMGHLWVLQKRI